MNIWLDKTDKEKLKELINKRNLNFKALEIFSQYLNNCPYLVTSELVAEITEECNVSEETAFISILSAACDLDTENDESDRAFERRYFYQSVKKLDEREYSEDPYLTNIVFPKIKEGAWEFTYLSYAPYEGFIRDDILLCEDLTEIPRLGFFSGKYSYPAVTEGEREWMAVKPNEIETMKEPIETVNGRVLTLGLGLGYFTYMASEKETVTEITVIEKDKTVIELFNKHILPQFKNKDKVNVICTDAFEYVENILADGEYDFVFADTWHDVSDGFDMYIRLKNSENKFIATKFLYWIEKSLLSHLRWLLFDNLAETVLMDKSQDGKGEAIRSLDGIKRFLSDENLRRLARNVHRA